MLGLIRINALQLSDVRSVERRSSNSGASASLVLTTFGMWNDIAFYFLCDCELLLPNEFVGHNL